MASMAGLGKIKVVRGYWNDAYLSELENFDGDPDPKKKKDQVDASSLGFNLLEGGAVVESTITAVNPEIKEKRGIDVKDDMRVNMSAGRKSLI